MIIPAVVTYPLVYICVEECNKIYQCTIISKLSCPFT